MPDFSTVEIVKSPSYATHFSCYFYPLDREKTHNFIPVTLATAALSEYKRAGKESAWKQQR
jgi:hypothetical protein